MAIFEFIFKIFEINIRNNDKSNHNKAVNWHWKNIYFGKNVIDLLLIIFSFIVHYQWE
jgi:hypothetical protein